MYEVLIFKSGLESLSPKILIENLENRDKYCRYDEILGYYLHKLIPNSIFRVVTDLSDFIRPDYNFYIGEKDYYGVLGDDNSSFSIFDMITIKNIKTQDYVHIDFQDGPQFSKIFAKNSNCKLVYSCMTLDMVRDIDKLPSYNAEIIPFTFFDPYPYYTESFVNKVKSIRQKRPKIPKMIFYGTLGNLQTGEYCVANSITSNIEEVRRIVKIIKEKYPDLIDVADRNEKLERSKWWELAAEYSVALTIPGHPWCSREHEFWSLGIPTLANTYTCPLLFPLIPNKHYIDAGTGGKDFMDREIDQELGADLIVQKFLEVRNYSDYIDKIVKNAQERYKKFIYPENTANLLLQDIKKRGFFK